jgi:hypothetical protein
MFITPAAPAAQLFEIIFLDQRKWIHHAVIDKMALDGWARSASFILTSRAEIQERKSIDKQ